jgi:hypothetical protein
MNLPRLDWLRPRAANGRGGVDAVIVLALFVFAWSAAVAYHSRFDAAGARPFFYQKHFAPAVSFACGHGYRTTDAATVTAFLQERTRRFDCSDLDPSLLHDRLNAFERISRYLELTVAFIWSMRGVSWDALVPLAALFTALTSLAVYGVLRLGAHQLVAAIGALAFTVSPGNLGMIPHLRDYAKATFLITAIFLIGLIVRRPRTPRQLVQLASVAGALLGIGLGFRNDILVAIVPVLVALCLADVVGPRPARAKGAAVLAFMLAGVVAGWPVVRDYGEGSNTGHVMILGLGESFSHNLDVRPSFYEFAPLYDDSYVALTLAAFAERTGTSPRGGLALGTKAYDAVSVRFLRELLRTFPADFVVRGYAAIERVFLLPRTITNERLPGGIPGWLNPLVEARASVVRRLGLSFAVLSVIVLALLLVFHPRAGLAAIVVTGIFAGGAMLQFGLRHVFHLELLAWCGLAYAISAAALLIRGLVLRRRGAEAAPGLLRPSLAGALVLGVVACTVPGVLALARAAQRQTATAFFDRYASAASRPVPISRQAAADATLVGFDFGEDLVLSADRPWRGTLALLEFGGATCDLLHVNPLVRYRRDNGPGMRWRMTVPIPRPPALTRLFLPVFDSSFERFSALEFAGREADCLASARVVDREVSPVLLIANLGPGWRRATPYQTFDWESARDTQSSEFRVFTDPRGLPAPRSGVDSVRGVPSPTEVVVGDRAVEVGRTITIAGTPAGEYLFETAHARLPDRGIAVVDGHLARGELTVEVVHAGGRVIREVHVTGAGAFTAVLYVPATSAHKIRVSASRRSQVRASIRNVGWALWGS